MIAEYCEHFDLTGDPFNKHAFYITPDLESLADQIIHASQFSAGFVVVCGAQGVGKTSFAQFFYRQLITTQDAILLEVTKASSAQSLLLQLADFLALPVSTEPSMGELLAQLRTVINAGDEALVVTVVLDNAHLLADETLAAFVSLLQVPTGHHRPFSFVLLSELELATRLDQFQMPDVAVQDITFPLMAAADVTAMLNYRLELVGYLGEPLFSVPQTQKYLRQADGHLGKLFELARAGLQTQAAKGVTATGHFHKSPLPVVHIAAVAGLLATLGLFYLYQGGDTQPENQVKQLPAPPLQIPEQEKPQVSAEALHQQASSVAVQSAPEEARVDAAAPLQGSEVVEQVEVITDDALTATETAVVATGSDSDVKSEGTAEAQAAAPAAVEAKPRSAIALTSHQSSAAWPNDEAEILSWPVASYSLQVLGVSSQAAATAYVQRQTNRDYLRIMETRRSAKPWYIVLVGRYDSLDQAKQAATSLPAEQVKAGPWPRKVKQLQDEIQAY